MLSTALFIASVTRVATRLPGAFSEVLHQKWPCVLLHTNPRSICRLRTFHWPPAWDTAVRPGTHMLCMNPASPWAEGFLSPLLLKPKLSLHSVALVGQDQNGNLASSFSEPTSGVPNILRAHRLDTVGPLSVYTLSRNSLEGGPVWTHLCRLFFSCSLTPLQSSTDSKSWPPHALVTQSVVNLNLDSYSFRFDYFLPFHRH